jgi:hypothetical protein
MKKTIFIQNILLLFLSVLCCSVFYYKKIDNTPITKTNIEKIDKNLQLSAMINRDMDNRLNGESRNNLGIEDILEKSKKDIKAPISDLQETLNALVKRFQTPQPKPIFSPLSNDIIRYHPPVQSSADSSAAYIILSQIYRAFIQDLDKTFSSDSIPFQTDRYYGKLEAKQLLQQQKSLLNFFKSSHIMPSNAALSSLDSNQKVLFFKNMKANISLLQYELTYNLFALNQELYAANPLDYQVVLYPERVAQVGKSFKADIFLSAYYPNQATKMTINNRPVRMKKGIGYFDFTAKKKGINYFDVEIEYNNLTSRTYKRGEKFQVEVW